MNQADVSKLVSKLRIKIPSRHRNLKNPEGPEGRLNKLRKIVTALVKHERIELNYNKADEARQYAERLISESIRYGDRHKATMEMADFWLLEKNLIHKLYKVLAPRYSNYETSYTRMFKLSKSYPNATNPRSVLELKGNPYPPLLENTKINKNLLHNVLLEAARKEYLEEQFGKMTTNLSSDKSKTEIDDADNKTEESKDLKSNNNQQINNQSKSQISNNQEKIEK